MTAYPRPLNASDRFILAGRIIAGLLIFGAFTYLVLRPFTER